MESKILNFKDNKIQEITLEELASTVKEEDYNGKPIMGMYHYEYITAAILAVTQAGLKHELEPIWAAQNQDKSRPGVSVIEKYRESYGEGDVRSFLLRRIFSRIIITDEQDELTNTAIALCYNQMGFQLAYGPNVRICQNQCILGANKFMSTYASEAKMPTPGRLLEVLGDWLKDFKKIRKQEKTIIEAFQGTVVPEHEILEIVGDLTTKRIRKENAKLFPREPVPPLNQSQIGKFAEKWLVKKAEMSNPRFTLWDVYNYATELYKPGETDYPILLSSNHAMSQYLIQRYNIQLN
jgi:hypothetical protein